jgi:hypothetical protein
MRHCTKGLARLRRQPLAAVSCPPVCPQVEGIDMLVPLPFHKVIYVMEDVDAASHVVQKREGADPLAALMTQLREASTTREQQELVSGMLTWCQVSNGCARLGRAAVAPITFSCTLFLSPCKQCPVESPGGCGAQWW